MGSELNCTRGKRVKRGGGGRERGNACKQSSLLLSPTSLSSFFFVNFSPALHHLNAWNGEDKLHQDEFITYLNNLHPTIKFTGSFSKSEILFLDVNLLQINGTLQTDLYVKPDKHQYPFKSSCHPSHTKKSIPYSMALRLRKICWTDDFFHKRPNALTTRLIKREYKHCFIQQEIKKVPALFHPATPSKHP